MSKRTLILLCCDAPSSPLHLMRKAAAVWLDSAAQEKQLELNEGQTLRAEAQKNWVSSFTYNPESRTKRCYNTGRPGTCTFSCVQVTTRYLCIVQMGGPGRRQCGLQSAPYCHVQAYKHVWLAAASRSHCQDNRPGTPGDQADPQAVSVKASPTLTSAGADSAERNAGQVRRKETRDRLDKKQLKGTVSIGFFFSVLCPPQHCLLCRKPPKRRKLSFQRSAWGCRGRLLPSAPNCRI